jgi:hypothetical protein
MGKTITVKDDTKKEKVNKEFVSSMFTKKLEVGLSNMLLKKINIE